MDAIHTNKQALEDAREIYRHLEKLFAMRGYNVIRKEGGIYGVFCFPDAYKIQYQLKENVPPVIVAKSLSMRFVDFMIPEELIIQ